MFKLSAAVYVNLYVPIVPVLTVPVTLTELVKSPSHLSLAVYPGSLYLLFTTTYIVPSPFKVITGPSVSSLINVLVAVALFPLESLTT